MKGIEISESFYNEHFKTVLENDFSDIFPFLAVGLVGSGSECFGYDDDLSKDHDFDCGFCVFYSENSIDRKRLFALERAYYNLPSEYMGIKRQKLNPGLNGRRGVISIEDFYKDKCGRADGEIDPDAWLSIPENYLLEATNGKVFIDNLGSFSKIRERLSHFPTDVRLKKIAGNLILMSQAGLYNYERCLTHGEEGAAQLSIIDFSKYATNLIFLINDQYVPFYKWTFRAMREQKRLSNLESAIVFLLTSDNSKENVELKKNVIGDIVNLIKKEISSEFLDGKSSDEEIEKIALKINDLIKNNELRNLNILAGVN